MADHYQLSHVCMCLGPQVLTGKFQRAMESKVEAEERALQAETRAAEREYELTQACALAQFCKCWYNVLSNGMRQGQMLF